MRDQKVHDARAVAGVTSTRSNVAGTGIEPMPRPQTNRSAISAAMEKGRIADSSEETATSDKAHRSVRSEEHTSELQSLMRISYAVFCLKKKKKKHKILLTTTN